MDEEALSIGIHQLWLKHSKKLFNVTEVVSTESLVEVKVVDVQSVVTSLVKQII